MTDATNTKQSLTWAEMAPRFLKSRAEAMTAPRLREQCRAGIFFLLAFALLAQSAWGQRLGPLVKDNQQQSEASSAESTAAAVQPPSLQLSLPSPAVAALLPLGPDDLQRLQPQEGRPPVIGVHRRLPPGAVTQSFSGGAVKTTAEGAWQSTAAGRLWRLRITSPSARAMRVHFRDFAIGAGKLWLYSADGQVVGPYSGSGLYGDGDFWRRPRLRRQPDDRISARSRRRKKKPCHSKSLRSAIFGTMLLEAAGKPTSSRR